MGCGCFDRWWVLPLVAVVGEIAFTVKPIRVVPHAGVVAFPGVVSRNVLRRWIIGLVSGWSVAPLRPHGRVARPPSLLLLLPPLVAILGTAVVVEVVAWGPLACGCTREGEHTTKDDRTPHGTLQAYLYSALERPPQ